VPFLSTVTGKEIASDVLCTPQYWIDHLLRPVLFLDVVKSIADREVAHYVEMGADSTLTRLAKAILGSSAHFADAKAGAPAQPAPEQQEGIIAVRYPQGIKPHRMLQSVARETFAKQTVCTSRLHSGMLSEWLADHVVYDKIILPGAALLELSLAVSGRYFSPSGDVSTSQIEWLTVQGFAVTEPVIVTDVRSNFDVNSTAEWQPTTTLSTVVDDNGGLEIYSVAEDARTLHVQAQVGVTFKTGQQFGDVSMPDWKAIKAAATDAASTCKVQELGRPLYESFAASGLKLGSTFRLLTEARCSESTCIGQLNISDIKLKSSYLCPPPLIDAMMHPCAVLVTHYRRHFGAVGDIDTRVQVPYSFDEVWFSPDAVQNMWNDATCLCHVTIRSVEQNMTVFDCVLLTAENQPVLYMKGVYTRSLSQATEVTTARKSFQELESTWLPCPVTGAPPAQLDGKYLVLYPADQADTAACITQRLRCEARSLTEIHDSDQTDLFDGIIVLTPRSSADTMGDSSEVVRALLSTLKYCGQYAKSTLVVSQISAGDDMLIGNALGGMLLCAQQEFPSADIRSVGVDLSVLADPVALCDQARLRHQWRVDPAGQAVQRVHRYPAGDNSSQPRFPR
jgi:acyl transferase domain-containing protein